MTTGQKIIKYLAILFAMMIIINIIGGIASGLMKITSLFNGNKNANENVYVYTVEEINKVDNLKIDLKMSNLTIKSGETFSIQTNNRHVKQNLSNETLTIKENRHFNFSSNNDVIITIPVDKIFNKIDISMGAGNINSEDLTSLYLDIDAGAGNITFNNLSVTEEFELDGGAGNITINNGKLQRTTDVSGNGYYTAVNHGTMTINGGMFMSGGEFSSMIENGYWDYNAGNITNGYVQG